MEQLEADAVNLNTNFVYILISITVEPGINYLIKLTIIVKVELTWIWRGAGARGDEAGEIFCSQIIIKIGLITGIIDRPDDTNFLPILWQNIEPWCEVAEAARVAGLMSPYTMARIREGEEPIEFWTVLGGQVMMMMMIMMIMLSSIFHDVGPLRQR